MNEKNININLKQRRLNGNLSYEYNPFYNYQTDVRIIKVLIDNIEYLVPENKAIVKSTGEILDKYKTDKYKDSNGILYEDDDDRILTYDDLIDSNHPYIERGSLVDFTTNQLNFDLNHPVDITILPSYDGSVNLILNDDKNIPRLINSRFSVREHDTFEIVDRIGENDTNIYSSDSFDKDTSLYFQYEYNPKIKYNGFCKGSLQVGQYCFYLTYCDADDNESDFITESGLIPIFLGSNSDPHSMDGGIKNQNSNKGIILNISNLDKSYNYLKVYYVRYLADYLQNRVFECKKIYKKYLINSNILDLLITGNEPAEDLDANIINLNRFNPKSIYTQALCKNILFFGNIVRNIDNYRELTDCALRILPKLKITNNFTDLNTRYKSYNNNYGYYDISNVYNKTGYFNEELYRFGVVFIYNNGTLSNVYNTSGFTLTKKDVNYKESLYHTKENNILLQRQYIEIDNDGWITNENLYIDKDVLYLNAKGVCKIDIDDSDNTDYILGITFQIPPEVILFLKENLGIRGLFFVRQKRVPNILALCYLLPMDEVLEGPVLEVKNKSGDIDEVSHYTECFVTLDKERLVTNTYDKRLYKYKNDKSESDNSLSLNAYAGICPDFLLNLPYYNLIFNGSKFKLEKITENSNLVKTGRFYELNFNNTKNIKGQTFDNITINSVTENVSSVAILDKVFKLEMGLAEESFRFKYAEEDTGTYDLGDEKRKTKFTDSTNIVRGIYSPYLAIYSDSKLETSRLYNIYQENSNTIVIEYLNRMNLYEPFYSISDRYNFEELSNNQLTCYRGDCYLNIFTYRLNRNFNDPTLPNNDEIIDQKTWITNYVEDSTKWKNISRSDLNAVEMGSWITIKLKSSYNYALRSQDRSYVSEEALMGTPRSFYPKSMLLYDGSNKIPDSYLYNDAYRASLGYKHYNTLENINYLKDVFSNRILYSAISITDSYKNNYRYSLSTFFRDYSLEYGKITKLVESNGNLVVIFDHGIGIATINERILAGGGDGDPVFINTLNVLPEELFMISDTIGTQWPESVVKSESGIIYGVDTIAKKIWAVNGQNVQLLSDLKINKFLVDNITLNEREFFPFVGLRNVKTHYNNNKKDIMFTFYDDVYQDEEKVWSICFNEIYEKFVTFYSWVPSYSENIDTQFFSFDRNSSKLLSLLTKCNFYNSNSYGVLLDTPIIEKNDDNEYNPIQLYYKRVKPLKRISLKDYSILETSEDEVVKNAKFELEKDHWLNSKLFEITENEEKESFLNIKQDCEDEFESRINEFGAILLLIRPKIDVTPEGQEKKEYIILKSETIIITTKESLKNIDTGIYIHGKAGSIYREDTYPCFWYGKLHPFEFEFVVNDNIAWQKVFNNLKIVSNKAEPESFHFEIEGDNYEFSLDKRNMYFRQESTKELFLNLGSNILFDREYVKAISENYTKEQYYRAYDSDYTDLYEISTEAFPIEKSNLVLQVKSTIFPLYYERVDTYDNIYHNYTEMTGANYDFKNLSGSEIIWNKDLNQFNIVSHIKNSPIDYNGRLRGNSRYLEGKWNVQIPSIIFNLKNEDKWKDYPPIVINSSNVPSDLSDSKISEDKIPNIYTRTDRTSDTPVTEYIDLGDWDYRKETKIRDKWIKIRIRYSGENLAIIHSIITLYNISHS